MIIEKEKRRGMLLGYGVPSTFLDALDNTKAFDGLEFVVKYPVSAYWRLPDILPTCKVLKGYDVTPICESANGDIFYLLLSNANEARFVRFELENDEVVDDYGNNFMLMFVDFLIYYYEFSDETSIETLTGYGFKMGFYKSAELFKALEEADSQGLRKTFELDKKWRKEKVSSFL